ncbi:uncharacterized protein LOC124167622 [Ischnura elegans]|uniref:uncharacterized protein LOC124167622 n=1 Tax=Ischnura elegans TaxID=197161 RepID=UPI001ED8A749|nr:uncharacterized protein LOC124167622 [Ischnura elegans]
MSAMSTDFPTKEDSILDARYKFIYVDVGVNGRVSDGGVFRESRLAEAINEERLNLPASRPLPGKAIPVPYVFIADDASPLTNRILKPYPFRDLTPEKRVYNFRLSRAQRVVENAFGILTNRFRVFLSVMNLAPEKVETVTLAAVALHNFLCVHNTNAYTTFEDPNEVTVLPGLPLQGANHPANSAINIRNEFSAYFNSVWQFTLFSFGPLSPYL